MSLVANEYNALRVNNIVVPESLYSDTGFYVTPSENVPDRPDDITGYYLRASDSNGKVEWYYSSIIPGGLTTNVQYNNNGALSGDANLTWTFYSQLLNINGTISVTELGIGNLTLSDNNSDYSIKLPNTQGSYGKTLVNDGRGNLSWTSQSFVLVRGPVSSTTNALCLFDGVDGDRIKNSDVTYASPTLTLSGTGSSILFYGLSPGATTRLNTSNSSTTSYTCSLPAQTGTLVIGPGSSTTNSIASFGDDYTLLNNPDVTYASPILTLNGTNSSISFLDGETLAETLVETSNGSATSYTCSLPAHTGTLVIGPSSSTTNSIVSFGPYNTLLSSSELVYSSPVLTIGTPNASISLKGSGSGTTLLTTSNGSYTCSVPATNATLAIQQSPIFYSPLLSTGGMYPVKYSYSQTGGGGFLTSGFGTYLKFTPTKYTKIRIMVTITYYNTSVVNNAAYTVVYGTGTPPIADQNAGTFIAGGVFTNTTNEADKMYLSTLNTVKSGLTLNTEYWFDINTFVYPTDGYLYHIFEVSMMIDEIVY